MVQMEKKKIGSESEFRAWFRNNYESLGFDEIITSRSRSSPDYQMKRDGEVVEVELETHSSNFIKHGHNPNKTDEVLCVVNDEELPIPTREVTGVEYEKRGKKKKESEKTKEISQEAISAAVDALREEMGIERTSSQKDKAAFSKCTTEDGKEEICIKFELMHEGFPGYLVILNGTPLILERNGEELLIRKPRLPFAPMDLSEKIKEKIEKAKEKM